MFHISNLPGTSEVYLQPGYLPAYLSVADDMPRSGFGPRGLGADVAHGGVELVEQQGQGLAVAKVRPEVFHPFR